MFNTLDHSELDVQELITNSKAATCALDPIPTKLLKQHVDIILPAITKMINSSLASGVFPHPWKQAIVTPLLKKPGLDLTFKNFRPVSNLPYVSKLTEQTVACQATQHMEENAPLPECQSAYRKYHSTETALTKIQSDILMNMEHQSVTLLVMIDLSAAFDTVDHPIMLNRLQHRFGISGRALDWFASYLDNREQRVSINGTVSSGRPIYYGVPQGSCLGPIMYTQYASTLFEVVQRHLVNIRGYADDHALYVSFHPNTQGTEAAAVSAIKNCLTDVKTWMLENTFKMNDSKTELIIFGSKQQLAKLNTDSLCVGDTKIHTSTNIRNLGAYLDETMSMTTHIDAKCRSAFMHLYNLRGIRKFLTPTTTECLVHAFITSQLDYANSLLVGVPAVHMEKLQRIQNMSARLIAGARKFDRITPILKELHWLPVTERVKFKVLLLTFKALHGMSPQYIADMIKVSQQERDHRSNYTVTLQGHTTKCSTFGDRAFCVSAPRLWNELPPAIRTIHKLSTFKSKLKTHLFKNYFK